MKKIVKQNEKLRERNKKWKKREKIQVKDY